jgi:hypothetical protein
VREAVGWVLVGGGVVVEEGLEAGVEHGGSPRKRAGIYKVG